MKYSEQELEEFIEQANMQVDPHDKFKDPERWSETVDYYRHHNTAPEPQQDTKEWESLNGRKVDTAGMTMEPQQGRWKHCKHGISELTPCTLCGEEIDHQREQQERDALVQVIHSVVYGNAKWTDHKLCEQLTDAILAAYRLEKR